MFHPVGSQPPSVYWRRRLLLLSSIALLMILLVLTVKIAASDGGTKPLSVGGTTTPGAGTSTHHQPKPAPHTSARTTPHPTTSAASGSGSGSSSGSSSAAAPGPCTAGKLSVSAVAGQATYHVGDQPVLELQVINQGPKPCVQDLADKQIELRVYNGESRVWGSHDCQIQPGTNLRTLAVNQPVRVAITWSGLTSQPNCAGTRQRVGAGNYTLYAVLAGKTGKAATFTIN
jgi:hypothetical protein